MSQDNLIGLACSVCKRVNYYSKRNKKKVRAKVELMKYCRWDKRHTKHVEAKLKG